MVSIHNKLAGTAEIPVALSECMITGSGAVMARDAQGAYSISLPTAATAYIVGFPLSTKVPTNNAAGSDPHGFRLETVTLWYSIGAVNASANTLTLNQETMIGAAARAAVTAFGGSLTYNTNSGASAAMGTTFGATAYLTVVTLGTPVWLSTSRGLYTGEWSITTGAASGTAKIHGILLGGSFALTM